MAGPVLLTAGYAGHDVQSFLALLVRNKVEMVVDVRRNPVSRKRGFSRRKLTELLEQRGIRYVHLPALGVPNELRQQLRERTIELAQYFDAFRQYLAEQPAAIDEALQLVIARRCVLVCVEHEPQECHRSVVAEQMFTRSGGKLQVEHL